MATIADLHHLLFPALPIVDPSHLPLPYGQQPGIGNSTVAIALPYYVAEQAACIPGPTDSILIVDKDHRFTSCNLAPAEAPTTVCIVSAWAMSGDLMDASAVRPSGIYTWVANEDEEDEVSKYPTLAAIPHQAVWSRIIPTGDEVEFHYLEQVGNYLLVSQTGENLIMYDANSVNERWVVDAPVTAAFLGQTHCLVYSEPDNTLSILDNLTGQVIHTADIPALNPNSFIMAAVNDGRLHVLLEARPRQTNQRPFKGYPGVRHQIYDLFGELVEDTEIKASDYRTYEDMQVTRIKRVKQYMFVGNSGWTYIVVTPVVIDYMLEDH